MFTQLLSLETCSHERPIAQSLKMLSLVLLYTEQSEFIKTQIEKNEIKFIKPKAGALVQSFVGLVFCFYTTSFSHIPLCKVAHSCVQQEIIMVIANYHRPLCNNSWGIEYTLLNGCMFCFETVE